MTTKLRFNYIPKGSKPIPPKLGKLYNPSEDIPDLYIRDREKATIFATPEDFNTFYKKHYDALMSDTTSHLNKIYKIPGYLISRSTKTEIQPDGKEFKNTILTLRRDRRAPTLHEETRIELLEEKVNQLIEMINDLSDHVINIAQEIGIVEAVEDQ